MEQRSQPPRGPAQPDDVRNYGAGSLMGQVINALKTGWNHAVALKSTLAVTGATTLGGAFTQGSNAFPAHAAGQVHFRTDKKTWYYDDGTNWNVVGVEQSIFTNAAPAQTINTTVHTDITSSSISVTTTGAGVLTLVGWVRVSGNTGTFIWDALLNGFGATTQGVTAVTADHTVPVIGRTAVAAAGTYTCKLQGWMAAGATQATVQSFLHLVEVVAA